MIHNITQINFEARLTFKPANSEVKKISTNKRALSMLHNTITAEPKSLLKFIFGIKKQTKLPTIQGKK